MNRNWTISNPQDLVAALAAGYSLGDRSGDSSGRAVTLLSGYPGNLFWQPEL